MPPTNGPRFVIQRHRARTLHYDFRLERDGVLKSWALPKEMPAEAGIQRLAIQTEDHELSFGAFQGVIAQGEYGAGTIEIWDRGHYAEESWSDHAITVSLYGTIVTGRYSLVRFPRGGEKAWLLSKEQS